MGKLDILRSGYSGKVGATYGVQKSTKFIAKAVPFSHTPFNQKQITARQGFERLNRVSSIVARNFWRFLGYSDKNMYKNNAVTHAWKSALINREFYLENLDVIIQADENLKIVSESFNKDTQIFSAILENKIQNPEKNGEKVFVAILTENYFSKFVQVSNGAQIIISAPIAVRDYAQLQLFAFKSVLTRKKYVLQGLCVGIPFGVYVQDEIFYTSKVGWELKPYYENETIYFVSNTIYENPETAKII